MAEINQMAPTFVLPDMNSNLISLESFRGKWVILYFYPKDNTSGCTQEACDFSLHISDFNKLDAVVIGISPDSPQSHKKFFSDHNLKVILLSDITKNIIKKYEAWGNKKLYGKEYDGVIRSTYIINPLGAIEAVWKSVKVKEHIKEVMEQLEKLKKISEEL